MSLVNPSMWTIFLQHNTHSEINYKPFSFNVSSHDPFTFLTSMKEATYKAAGYHLVPVTRSQFKDATHTFA
jgi:hypothetical protein